MKNSFMSSFSLTTITPAKQAPDDKTYCVMRTRPNDEKRVQVRLETIGITAKNTMQLNFKVCFLLGTKELTECPENPEFKTGCRECPEY